MTEPKISQRGRREKGHDGEREFTRLLSEALGVDLERNVDQARAGGADLLVGGYAVQVKRKELLSLGAWWAQAVADAKKHQARPALAWRQNRKPWQVMIRLQDLTPDIEGNETVILSLIGFILVNPLGEMKR